MQLGIQVKEIRIMDKQISIKEVMQMYCIEYETARKRVVKAQNHAKEVGTYIYSDKGYAILSTILELFGPPINSNVLNFEFIEDIKKASSDN